MYTVKLILDLKLVLKKLRKDFFATENFFGSKENILKQFGGYSVFMVLSFEGAKTPQAITLFATLKIHVMMV